MGYRVALYCPDRHIVYDGRTPDEVGVGGGITARIRMGRALARAGNTVTQIVNCPKAERLHGVEYVPLDAGPPSDIDVLVMNTSGGALDLSPAQDLAHAARLRIVWLHGTVLPKGMEGLTFDVAYAVSKFVAKVAVHEWGLSPSRLFVAYNGYEERLFVEAERSGVARDPFRLVYISHPSKGLEAALGVVRRLRSGDRRFELHVFGGARLWGQEETGHEPQDGLHDHGLVGQRALARELLRCAFAVNLQNRPEPLGMTVLEAMRAGCVVLVSPVGALPELVRDGWDGIVVPGNPASEATQRAAAERILALAGDPSRQEMIRRNARPIPWDTDTMANVWTAHWAWLLEGRSPEAGLGRCPRCAGQALLLADGAHCTVCAHYERTGAGALQ